jgi:hypothetical protein
VKRALERADAIVRASVVQSGADAEKSRSVLYGQRASR